MEETETNLINTKLSKGIVGWILSRPEGKQFLSATLFAIILLVACIVKMELRYEKSMDNKDQQIQKCQEEKQAMKKEDDERFLNYLLLTNGKLEQQKIKYDSLNSELVKFIKR